MKKKDIILGVTSIQVVEEKYILIVKKQSVFFQDSSVFQTESEAFGILMAKDKIYFADYNSQYISGRFFDGNNEFTYQIPFEYEISFCNVQETKVIISTNQRKIENDKRVYDIFYYDFIKRELENIKCVNKKPLDNIQWKGHLLFDETKFLLSAFSIEKKETIWQFKLFEHFKYDRTWGDGEFYHFIGVWNDILWIDIKTSHLIGVDVHSGQLKYDFCKPSKIYGQVTQAYHEQLHEVFYSNIDEDRNSLFGFHYDTYWEVNLNNPTPELHFYIFEEECKKYNSFAPNPERYCFDKQYLYYVDAFNGTVASIDRDTKDFHFLYQFPEASAGTLMEIQVSEDKVYILDNQSTLHIFEKETLA